MVAEDSAALWQRDLGDGRIVVVKRVAEGFSAALSGLCGVGSTQEEALDDLLVRMRSYCETSTDLSRSLASGGELDRKLQQIRSLVNGNLVCPHCLVGEPSVWDGVLDHFAHPAAGGKLSFCHRPWRDRCRRCSADPGSCSCSTAEGAP